MGYISAKQGEGFIVSATKGLWVYWAIAIPLVVVTMGAYIIYEFFRRRAKPGREQLDKHLAAAVV